MSTTESKSFDSSRRRLCPDGACIGLLDESGRCKECGLVAGGGRAAAPASTLAPPDIDMDGDDQEEMAMGAEPEAGPAFDPKRRLCPEGACVGVIGADGRCSVCGRTAEE